MGGLFSEPECQDLGRRGAKRLWKLFGSKARAGSITNGERERIVLWFWSEWVHQPRCQTSLLERSAPLGSGHV